MNINTIRLTPSAERDLDSIRDYSEKRYGIRIANAYEKLIAQALKDLKNDPLRFGSKQCSDIYKDMQSYHIRFSKNNANSIIKSPRHVVFYFTLKKNELLIARILHDSREPIRNMRDLHEEVMKKAILIDDKA